jgi:hypothetical protein
MPSRDPLKTAGPVEKVLLVEGPEDFHTICQLLDVHGIHDGVTIESLGGYTEIISDLKTRVKRGDEAHLGIIVDADTDLENRWRSLRDMLVRFEYLEPS